MSATTTETKFKIECEPQNAQRFWHWIKTRQGIARWRSINLSNPGASWSSPVLDKDGNTYQKPNWQCDNTPEITTDPKEVGVTVLTLYKAFPVALRRSSNGLSFKLTDAATRRLNSALAGCEKKHGSASFKRGVLDIDGASVGVYYNSNVQPLDEWIAANGEGNPEEWE